MLILSRCGLDFQQAKALCIEEVLCILRHDQLRQTLSGLDAEMARVASLVAADQAEQQKALSSLAHRREAALDAFYATHQTGEM